MKSFFLDVFENQLQGIGYESIHVDITHVQRGIQPF